MKKLSKIANVKVISKSSQKNINGGGIDTCNSGNCPWWQGCHCQGHKCLCD